MSDRTALAEALLSRLTRRGPDVVLQLCPTCDEIVEAVLTTHRRGALIVGVTSRCGTCDRELWRET